MHNDHFRPSQHWPDGLAFETAALSTNCDHKNTKTHLAIGRGFSSIALRRFTDTLPPIFHPSTISIFFHTFARQILDINSFYIEGY